MNVTPFRRTFVVYTLWRHGRLSGARRRTKRVFFRRDYGPDLTQLDWLDLALEPARADEHRARTNGKISQASDHDVDLPALRRDMYSLWRAAFRF
ncbi:unnamed protein product, partial [Iphiclides podalirius]